MPLYEYVCHDCKGDFEALVRRFGDGVVCPACSSDHVEKQLSVFAVASHTTPTAPACGAGACATEPGPGPGPCGGGACGLPS